MDIRKKQKSLQIDAGNHEIIIEQRYQVLSNLNNLLLGILFLIGSVLFLSKDHQTFAISFFIAGSFLMVVRAVMDIAKNTHLKRLRGQKKPDSG
ncbi:YrhK family protein [Indiicoccus explosivorum]|uniref:YrhK family protein n=1 Tax=Indiicoccus explosivorum TaxID=1917864 RepID=UPI000B4449EE|nr:YrhK family protein [Indiicoccus explosivorum]